MGNKAILMSIQPRWVAEILNGNKTIEVRKRFPKDFKGWVYIYCTKGKEQLYSDFTEDGLQFFIDNKAYGVNILNGKVVARFWCDKVEEIECVSVGDSDYGSLCADTEYCTETLNEKELTQKSCLLPDEIFEYLDEDFDKIGYAIHISRLEVFDKPKELKEFYCFGYKENLKKKQLEMEQAKDIKDFYQKQMQFFNECWQVKKAPQSWCYIEDK